MSSGSADRPSHAPLMVFADEDGQIFDHPEFSMIQHDGRGYRPPDLDELVPLPPGSDLFLLPGRQPVGGTEDGALKTLDATAVAAFMAPAWVRFALPAFAVDDDAPLLPLYAYAAVGYADGRFWVPATRIDPDGRQDLDQFDLDLLVSNIAARKRIDPTNTLLAHIADCATIRACPAARNFFLGRWEAPLPSSPSCNSGCIGCISEQPDDRSPTFGRIPFAPDSNDLANIAVPHLEGAEHAVVSFGQGCEGEPLLQGPNLEAAILDIRERTERGVININTNGSRPDVLERLCEAGLNAIRVSLNSARKPTYDAYYIPRGYSFEDVRESLRIARRYDLKTSVNWLVFPGVSDCLAEVEAMEALIRDVDLDLIQVRNLNIDPDLYMEALGDDWSNQAGEAIGMAALLRRLQEGFPALKFGYFNPPNEGPIPTR